MGEDPGATCGVEEAADVLRGEEWGTLSAYPLYGKDLFCDQWMWILCP